MAIDNQFRIDELISKGSRAIISKDSQTGNHTFTVGSKQIINDPYPHTKGDRDGEQIGTIEKPKYNEEELVKAVDTVVDELISAPKKEQPPVVPKPLYDDLRRLYDERGVRISELEGQVRNLLSTISELEALIESLQIELDAAKLQQAVAENQAQQTNEQYVALLQDFSQAVIKSTKEGIERVSLKAQTEGLIAQKESLREQLKALNLIVGQLKSDLAGSAAESAAAAGGFSPASNNESFFKFTQEGNDPAWENFDIGWTTSRKDRKLSGKAGSISINNLKGDGETGGSPIIKISISTTRGNLLGSTSPIIGFTDGDNRNAQSKTLNVETGVTEVIPLYFNTRLGGNLSSTPKPRDPGESARDYNGNMTFTLSYADGTTENITGTWGLRKNKG